MALIRVGRPRLRRPRLADLGRHFWLWFTEHQDDVVLTVLGVYRIRLRRLRALFIRIFGPPPVEA